MGILRHVEEHNTAAFNNMLKHVQRKGTDKTSLKERIPANYKTVVPIVQMRKHGLFLSYVSYNVLENLYYIHSWAGTIEAKWLLHREDVDAYLFSADCCAKRTGRDHD